MSSYISTLTLMDNTVAPESSAAGTFAEYAEGASRLFDLLCEVEDEFFNKAPATASAKTFYGNGIDMLRLPPYVGSIVAANILINDEVIEDEFRLENGYLINTDGDFDEDSTIVISARWGFAEIPPEVKTTVQELANYLYRNRDPMFTKMSDVETEREFSPTVSAAIKRFRDKYSQSYL